MTPLLPISPNCRIAWAFRINNRQVIKCWEISVTSWYRIAWHLVACLTIIIGSYLCILVIYATTGTCWKMRNLVWNKFDFFKGKIHIEIVFSGLCTEWFTEKIIKQICLKDSFLGYRITALGYYTVSISTEKNIWRHQIGRSKGKPVMVHCFIVAFSKVGIWYTHIWRSLTLGKPVIFSMFRRISLFMINIRNCFWQAFVII